MQMRPQERGNLLEMEPFLGICKTGSFLNDYEYRCRVGTAMFDNWCVGEALNAAGREQAVCGTRVCAQTETDNGGHTFGALNEVNAVRPARNDC